MSDKKSEKSSTDVKAKFKIRPSKRRNKKGYYTGDLSISLQSANLPIKPEDEVENLLDMITNKIAKDSDDANDKPTKEIMLVQDKDLFPIFEKELSFQPIKYKKKHWVDVKNLEKLVKITKSDKTIVANKT